MADNELTIRQWEMLDFVAAHVRLTLRMPTITEIMAHMGLSGKNGIVDHLNYMELKGFVIRNTSKTQWLAFLTVQCRDHFGLWFRDGTDEEEQEREEVQEEEDRLRHLHGITFVAGQWRRKYA